MTYSLPLSLSPTMSVASSPDLAELIPLVHATSHSVSYLARLRVTLRVRVKVRVWVRVRVERLVLDDRARDLVVHLGRGSVRVRAQFRP